MSDDIKSWRGTIIVAKKHSETWDDDHSCIEVSPFAVAILSAFDDLPVPSGTGKVEWLTDEAGIRFNMWIGEGTQKRDVQFDAVLVNDGERRVFGDYKDEVDRAVALVDCSCPGWDELETISHEGPPSLTSYEDYADECIESVLQTITDDIQAFIRAYQDNQILNSDRMVDIRGPEWFINLFGSLYPAARRRVEHEELLKQVRDMEYDLRWADERAQRSVEALFPNEEDVPSGEGDVPSGEAPSAVQEAV